MDVIWYWMANKLQKVSPTIDSIFVLTKASSVPNRCFHICGHVLESFFIRELKESFADASHTSNRICGDNMIYHLQQHVTYDTCRDPIGLRQLQLGQRVYLPRTAGVGPTLDVVFILVVPR